MTNTPDNIRNMWEQAAKTNESYPSPIPSKGNKQSDVRGFYKSVSATQPANKPPTEPQSMYGKLGAKEVEKMETRASNQGRPLTDTEQGAAVQHAKNAGNAEIKIAADKKKAVANPNKDKTHR